MRASMSFQDLIEEIAADAGLYLARSSGYRNIVPFVWDDTRRTEQYALLTTGLRKIRDIIDTVIIP